MAFSPTPTTSAQSALRAIPRWSRHRQTMAGICHSAAYRGTSDGSGSFENAGRVVVGDIDAIQEFQAMEEEVDRF